MKFEVFREREGNFYLSVIHSVRDVVEGEKKDGDNENTGPSIVD